MTDSPQSDLNFQCPTCEKRFSTKLQLKNHQRIHSTADYLCQLPGCTYSSKRKSDLQRHLKSHEKKNPGSTVNYDKLEGPVPKCQRAEGATVSRSTVPERSTENGSSQNDGESEHPPCSSAKAEERPYACVFCSFRAKRQWNLNRHYTRVHPESVEKLMKVALFMLLFQG